MAQIQYRANLSAKDFSFLASKWGRTVIMKQLDQNFSRQIVSAADPDKDIGIPQVYYCHNVMPNNGGFQSIFYDLAVPTALQAGGMSMIHWSVNTNNKTAYLAYVIQPDGKTLSVYALRSTSEAWVYVTNVAWSTSVTVEKVSSATVNGQTYVYIPYIGCYKYDPDANTFTLVTLTGLTATDVKGITAAYGYLIAYTRTQVAWSSTIDPTDFTPSLTTGAGGGSVQDAEGEITLCVHQIFGFVVFTAKNAVAAIYSGNARYPFNYRPVVGAGGCVDSELVGLDSESGNLYAWTSSGLQLVGAQQASLVQPEAANFIGGNVMEDFNDGTLEFQSYTIPQGSLLKKLDVVANRYLIISYGVITLTHAIVYDIGMKRWGKLKIQHERIFTFLDPDVPVDERARHNIAIFKENGTVYQVRMDIQNNQSNGTIILGKYQYIRNRLITLQEVDVENIVDVNSCDVYCIPTLDGKTPLPPVKLTPIGPAGTQNPAYNARISCQNFSLLFQGAFDLDSLMLQFINNGRR